jgi:tripartite-type tricarboxylate transporter receptor subunit TctC
VDVPYAGDGAIVPALLGGHIPIGLIAFPAIKSLLDAKRVKVLAMCTEKRASYAPDIPSVTELGYKLPYVPFLALYGPKGTPDEVVKKLDEVARKISEDKEFQNKCKNLTLELAYESSPSFEKTLVKYRQNLAAFFKEEDMIKK